MERSAERASARWGRRVLTAVFVGMVPLGLSIAFAYDSVLWAWHRGPLAQTLTARPELGADAAAVTAQWTAMLGGTIASWGIGMAGLCAGPLREGQRWAAWVIAASTATWFVIDTGLSLHHGVMVNVAFNVTAALGIALPLALCWPRRPARKAADRRPRTPARDPLSD